jgi:hypothetical protein
MLSRVAKSGLRSAGAIPIAVNEPILSFAPGSIERANLRAALTVVEATCKDIPIIIGGKEVRTDNVRIGFVITLFITILIINI